MHDLGYRNMDANGNTQPAQTPSNGELLHTVSNEPTAPEDHEFPLNRSDFGCYATEMFLEFEKMNVWAEQCLETKRSSIIVHARFDARTKRSESPYGTCDSENESIMIFRLADDGLRIRELEEFVCGKKAGGIKRWHVQVKGEYYGD
ncbi:hypothetical protein VTI74DRAFT_7773 [Chaetomium olivicolor]